MDRDGASKSLWQDEIFSDGQNYIPEEINFDVAIVGAGITGWSCATAMLGKGMKCIVLESRNAGFGSTGGTSAHLNTFFDASYDEVINDFGMDNAQLLAASGKDAISIIRKNISRLPV